MIKNQQTKQPTSKHCLLYTQVLSIPTLDSQFLCSLEIRMAYCAEKKIGEGLQYLESLSGLIA
jgi:hypothetical protein